MNLQMGKMMMRLTPEAQNKQVGRQWIHLLHFFHNNFYFFSQQYLLLFDNIKLSVKQRFTLTHPFACSFHPFLFSLSPSVSLHLSIHVSLHLPGHLFVCLFIVNMSLILWGQANNNKSTPNTMTCVNKHKSQSWPQIII